jgi:hypothetical protein
LSSRASATLDGRGRLGALVDEFSQCRQPLDPPVERLGFFSDLGGLFADRLCPLCLRLGGLVRLGRLRVEVLGLLAESVRALARLLDPLGALVDEL